MNRGEQRRAVTSPEWLVYYVRVNLGTRMSDERATSTAVVERDDQQALGEVLRRITALCELQDGWNGYDAVAPRSESIAAARRWIRLMFEDATATRYAWIDPLV